MSALSEPEKVTATASEDFKDNIQDGKRYVDKTKLLVPLLRRDHETTFFLRPRRFGKTLTLSMIRYFVEDTGDPVLNEENRRLFDGLKIMQAGEYYTSQMTSYPVLSLTFQTMEGDNFKEAFQELTDLVQRLYDDKSYLLSSEKLSSLDKRFFRRILDEVDETGKKVSRTDYKNALKRLTEFLRKDSGKRAVVLIDEYDVPLEKAYQKGYYRQMVDVIGPFLQNGLKTNSGNLQFAVVTGCLRIAKEGIYTGLNNPEINTVLTRGRNDAFGFTEEEVKELLTESGFADHYEEVEAWYDGYLFDLSRIYNPWSVIRHIEDLSRNGCASPAAHWAGTSENAIIRELAERADYKAKQKVEQLMQGDEITFSLRNDIVYDNLFQDPDNVFNVMLSTGYLTAVRYDAYEVRARIPNKEVHKIFRDKVEEWFLGTLPSFDVRKLYHAMEDEQPERVQSILNDKFLSAMSYYDTVEAFYHGVTLTLMQLNPDYLCTSNREAGSGRFDVQCRKARDWNLAFILEFKISDGSEDMLSDAKAAARQIRAKRYVAELKREGYKKIITYGIAFCGKKCRVVLGEVHVDDHEMK